MSDVVKDSLKEVENLGKDFKKAQIGYDQHAIKNFDSEFWFSVYFSSRKEKEKFLIKKNLDSGKRYFSAIEIFGEGGDGICEHEKELNPKAEKAPPNEDDLDEVQAVAVDFNLDFDIGL